MGHDWIVDIKCGPENEIITVTVFGVMIPEEAIKEARLSITALDRDYTDYEILLVKRVD